MEIAVIVSLIFLGILLLMLEFFVVTGTVVPGIIGIALMLAGVYLSYNNFGTEVGHFTLLATLIFIFITIYKLLKSNTWKKVTLNSSIESKVNEISNTFQIGDKGIAISRLAPMGKVMIKNIMVEAKAENEFINPKEEILVIDIESSKVIVTRNINNQ